MLAAAKNYSYIIIGHWVMTDGGAENYRPFFPLAFFLALFSAAIFSTTFFLESKRRQYSSAWQYKKN